MKLSNLLYAATLLLSTSVFAGDKIDEVLDISATGQISIESMRGEVEIVGWDKAQMTVVGELDDKAQGYTFESENGFTVFKVKMPKRMNNRGWNKGEGSKLKIHLPTGANVRFESVNGGVDIRQVAGGSDVHTVNGSIVAEGLSKRVKLETVNGKIRTTGLEGKIKLATVNGKITDEGSKGKVTYVTVNGKIEVDTGAERVFVENVNGSIKLNLQTVQELDISTVNGNVTASVNLADDAQVSVSTVSGSAKLILSGNTGGSYRLNSHAGGQINNELSDDEVKKQKYGPGRSLKFQLSGGDAQVEMTSVSGNLTIERK